MQDEGIVIDQGIEPRRAAAASGWRWISGAFALFRQSPTQWIALSAIFILLFLGIGAVPFAGGLAVYLLGPVFIGGIVQAAHWSSQGRTPQIADLLLGFKQNTAELVKVGGFYLLGLIVLVLGVTALLILAGQSGLSPDKLSNEISDLNQLSDHWLALLVLMLAFVIVYSTYFFAPALVMLGGVSAVEAMKLSFTAFWRNWLPITVMSIIGGGLIFLAMLPFFLGLILAIPVALLTSYTSYADIFGTGE